MRQIAMVLVTVCISHGYAQSTNDAVAQEKELQKDMQFFNQKTVNDDRDVIGVAPFKCDLESPYVSLVTEKVVEVLKNSNRFIVVDRTNRDKVIEELELQKREEFIGKDVAEQVNSLAAKKLIQGTITKIPVYRMKNSDGSVRGYKASVSFELKVDDVDTQQTTDAMSFSGKTSKECVSAQAAVQMAMNSLEGDLAEYFRVTFPLHAKIAKILSEKNGRAEVILIKVGKRHGVKVDDEFLVNSVEIFDGEEIPSTIGNVTVTKLVGEAFSECEVDKKAALPIYEQFKANAKLRCTLVVK